MNLILSMIVIAVVTLVVLLGIGMLGLLLILIDRTKTHLTDHDRLQTLETYVANIYDILRSEEENAGMFRSMDGKYTANSLEELIQKMAAGGEIDIDPNDPEQLKKFFEDLTKDEDGDDEDKPWEK